MSVYSYLIDGVLIDTGAQSLHKYFEAFIKDADFDQVMITHHHEDHTGCAAYIEKIEEVFLFLSMRKQSKFVLIKRIILFTEKPFGVVGSLFMQIQHQRPLNLEMLLGKLLIHPGMRLIINHS